ncbi:T9SS type A sorting domain-containing protein [Altibacter lentus]|uniref:T9SS type A sorting domain-containing protein n=1 Tax=Altibacter lentus TaxID=1223410 RepID=UPI0005596D4F|nr:T9SS type A sorting domain-containing protein [Altibacter lentus]
MKTTLFLFSISLFSLTIYSQPFQTNVEVANGFYHDINIETINDLSNDFAIAANIFDTNFTTQLMAIHRMNAAGTIQWSNTYTDAVFPEVRVLDVVNVVDKIYATGYVADGSGKRSTFIAEIQASNGAVLNAHFYDIVNPGFNSQGFKIVQTNSDANNDTVSDPGFLVVGLFGACQATDISCALNIGFVLRTDMNLAPIWTIELENNNSTAGTFDFDFINDITETPTGFFLTGSITGQVTPGVDQQGVLAYKIDFLGNPLWDQSYIFGNSQDVSVDAYYDSNSQQIFMLCNYSQTHYFGVTKLADATGVIDPGSWFLTGNDLNTYAFRIMESFNNPNTLLISGYDRDESWVDGSNNPQFGQTNVFVHEFNKNTGAITGGTRQYLVPHVEHGPEEFNFWGFQQPVIYYPDISLPYTLNDGSGTYLYHAGYRTTPNSTTAAELFAVPGSMDNECVNLDKSLTLQPLVFNSIIGTTGHVTPSMGTLQLVASPFNVQERICDDTLAVSDNELPAIKLYPNPASQHVYVYGMDLSSYHLLDSLGRVVLTGTLSSGENISLSTVVSGVYFLKIQLRDGRYTIKKLIVK